MICLGHESNDDLHFPRDQNPFSLRNLKGISGPALASSGQETEMGDSCNIKELIPGHSDCYCYFAGSEDSFSCAKHRIGS